MSVSFPRGVNKTAFLVLIPSCYMQCLLVALTPLLRQSRVLSASYENVSNGFIFFIILSPPNADVVLNTFIIPPLKSTT